GTNRINAYTVRRVTQGLANAIAELGEEAMRRGVVIAYDSRHLSPELAFATAATLVANGIDAYLFTSLRPTPELSFAVRELGTIAGIVLTASHNPPEYNGYKVYWEDGAQITPERAKQLSEHILAVQDFAEIKSLPQDEVERSERLHRIDRDVDDAYMARLKELVLNPEVIRTVSDDLQIVYTPLHGAGNESVQRILREVGFTRVFVVPEQEQPDPNFTTVKSPNPEEREAFTYALRHAEQIGADLIIGTDPDCDRVGVVVRGASGEFEVLTGNQTGALLVHYLISERAKRGQIPAGATIIKTIVTSDFGRVIAARYGVDTLETLTGFKYIGEKMREFETTGEHAFLFGYEESYGYLGGTFVRDKDAVMTTMQICEMAAFYKAQGLTLYEALQALYREFGYYKEHLDSITLKGIDGWAKIGAIMEQWRTSGVETVGGQAVAEVRDYRASTVTDRSSGAVRPTGLPQENALYFRLADGSWFARRPSGTEPKLKLYVAVRGETEVEADNTLQQVVDDVLKSI
ncbi:MAG: phospho-sugar mutase, partial [Tumebacillaceae bacterium]